MPPSWRRRNWTWCTSKQPYSWFHLTLRGATVTPRFSNGTLTSRPLSSLSSGLVVGTTGTVGKGNGGLLFVGGVTFFCVTGGFCGWTLGAGVFNTRLLGLSWGAFWVRATGGMPPGLIAAGVPGITFWLVGGEAAKGGLLRRSTKENRLSTNSTPRNSDRITIAGFNLVVFLCLAIFKILLLIGRTYNSIKTPMAIWSWNISDCNKKCKHCYYSHNCWKYSLLVLYSLPYAN